MKRILTVLILCVMVLTLPAASIADRMIVHVTCASSDASYIGTDWEGYYQLGDYQFMDGDIFELDVGPIDVYTRITDYDSSPDIGEVSSTYNVTANRLLKGFTVEQVLQVTEDKGRNRGYSATWYIYYDFSPVTDCLVIH